MKGLKLAIAGSALVLSCGGDPFGTGLEGEFSTVLFYPSTEQAYIESDITFWQNGQLTVASFNPNTNACDAQEVVTLCIENSFPPENIVVNFNVVPKQDYKGDFISNFLSPVALKGINVDLIPVNPSCPKFSFSQPLDIVLQPSYQINTDPAGNPIVVPVPQPVTLPLLSRVNKEYIFNLLGTNRTFTYTTPEGCSTNYNLKVFEVSCTYDVFINISAVELYSDISKTVTIRTSMTIQDIMSPGECQPGN